MQYYIGGIPFDSNYLKHHGILGQRKGVRNGPPYPLSRDVHNAVVSGIDRSVKKRMSKINLNERVTSSRRNETRKQMVNPNHEKLSQLTTFPQSYSITGDDLALINKKDDGDHIGRSYNCQNCACAFELVNRGYSVKARPMPDGSNVGDIEKYFVNGHLEPISVAFNERNYKDIGVDASDEEYESSSFVKDYRAAPKVVTNQIHEQGPGARGIIVVGWIANEYCPSRRTTSFHAFNYVVEDDGTVKYFDTQSRRLCTGTTDANDAMFGADPRDIYVMRTDNLMLNPSVSSTVYSR